MPSVEGVRTGVAAPLRVPTVRPFVRVNDSSRPLAGRKLLRLVTASEPDMQSVLKLQPLFPLTFVTGWSAARDVASSQYRVASPPLTAEPFQADLLEA